MRYRQLSAAGDYEFGRSGVFLVDSPAAVAQAIKTRLLLWTEEWFLDTDEGTPYSSKITGYGAQSTRDQAIRQRIINTTGVVSLDEYASLVDAERGMSVTARVTTQYGPTSITVRTS